MPRGKAAGGKKRWLSNMVVFTVAGGISSVLMGAFLGWLGTRISIEQVGEIGLFVASAVTLLAIARELGWSTIPLPQAHRQTNRAWAAVFPAPLPAALWGADLGLVFTTWSTFSGAWVLAIMAVVMGQPILGVSLFVSYWAGRALVLWMVPWLAWDAGATPRLLERISDERRWFHQIHVAGLGWVLAVLLVWIVQGG